jgi:hypothetical protein
MSSTAAYMEEPISKLKPSTLSIQKEVKRNRELNINNMGSGAIICHLTLRHRVGLLILSNLALITYIVNSKFMFFSGW